MKHLRALATEMANAKCKPILPFRPKMPTPLEVVKCNYCQKKKEKKEKKKGCYSAILNVESHYISIVKQKTLFYSPIEALFSHSLFHFFVLSSLTCFCSTAALSSPQTQNSIFLKPKTPRGGGSGRGRRGSSNMTSSFL